MPNAQRSGDVGRAVTSVYFAYYIPFCPVHIHDSKVFCFVQGFHLFVQG